MFEALIEKLILSYFGDYIENLDRKKLSVGILSGSLTLEDIVIKAKSINDMKLPFKLIFGRIGRLDIQIPWKSNFSAPTIINIDSVQVVLSLIPNEEWEFLDFFSGDYKLNLLKKFFQTRIAELTEAFVQEEKSSGYADRVLVKILDNLHINFKNLHIRIEDTTKKPFYSLGFTLEEMLVVNTNEKWEEKFIDRNKQKDINVFKLLKIKNFGFYLKTEENFFISTLEDKKKVQTEMNKIWDGKSTNNFNYLIKPISLIAKMKQNNKNQEEVEGGADLEIQQGGQLSPTPTQDIPKMQIWINLENFDIDFHKSQFDTLIRILNHTSNYQKYQYFHWESRKFYFYKPQLRIKDPETNSIIKNPANTKKWWRWTITTVIKRLKYLQGNSKEFELNRFLVSHYHKKFYEIYREFLKDPNSLSNEDWKLFKKILAIFDSSTLYEWAIENIQEYFKENKIEENKKAKKGFFSKMFGRGPNEEDNLLTKEEEDKIKEIIDYAKKEVKNQITYSGKETKILIEFNLREGSFNFFNAKKISSGSSSGNFNNQLTSQSNDNNSTYSETVEAFTFKYKNLSFLFKSAESFTEIEAYLMDFNIEMLTIYNKKNIKSNQITLIDKNPPSEKMDSSNSLSNSLNSTTQNYVWKLNFRQNSPEEKINSKLELHINTINIIYHQAFLERVLSFFIVETRIEEEIVNKAWDKWSEIKEKTSETIKLALEKKNILEITIEPRKLIVPLNKYDPKRSKLLVFEIGRVRMCNMEGFQYYDDQYLCDFGQLSIIHYNSFSNFEENINRYEIVTDLRCKLICGLLNSEDSYNNPTLKQTHPSFKMNLIIESIKINMTESVYYMFHFIIDVFKPTKQLDYWATIESSKQEIKKNCKAFGKLNKKNHLKQIYEEYFAVLSGGYIYFYKNVDDDDFSSYYYIKDATIVENIKEEPREGESSTSSPSTISKQENSSSEKNENITATSTPTLPKFEIILKNKYGNCEMEFTNESKFKQWVKGLKERINEMKSHSELDNQEKIPQNLSSENEPNEKAGLQTSVTQQIQTPISNQITTTQNPYLDIFFGIDINIKEVICNLYDESTGIKIFTLNLSKFKYNLLMRDKDIEMDMSLYSISIYDESFAEHKHKDSFYQILTSIDPEKSDYKLFTVSIIIAEKESPKYKNAGIQLDLKVGYLYAIWNPSALRRLLTFLAHNDIVRDRVKEEIMGVPATQGETQLQQEQHPISNDKNIKNENSGNPSHKITSEVLNPNEDKVERILCSSTPNDLWIYIDISLQKVSIIWVQPALLHYFMEVKMSESKLTFEMTYDHFYIRGTLGNTTLTDLTNYPYTIKSQEEYLELIQLKKENPENKRINFTEILGFKDSSSVSFDYKSYSFYCPLVKNNYTSSAYVNFSSVRFTYIQEHFFRMFNYLFAEFLGSLSASEEIKNYRSIVNQLPKLTNNLEFMDLHVKFNNPQLVLKARNHWDEGFLADLGTVVITNSYEKVKGKIRNRPEEERILSLFNFDLKNLHLESTSSGDSFKLIEDTNAGIVMKFINLSEEEKLLSDDVIDKSFDINILINDVNVNLRQKDFFNLMKCNDLNFCYIDGLDSFYDYEKNRKEENLKKSGSKALPDEVAVRQNSAYNLPDISKTKSETELLKSDYNSMSVNLLVPSISLRLFDNTSNTVFTELTMKDKSLTFVKKILGEKEINILIKSSEIYNYVSVFNKEIMLSYYNFNDSENSTSKIPNQFEIKIVFDREGEKNIILKIYNIKLTLRLDTLQLLKTFFTEGLPYYTKDDYEKDLPNQYDFDEDNYPGMRVYLEVKNPLITLLSETMTNHDQDVICLSTDLVFLYKKEKIIRARKELYNNFINLMGQLKLNPKNTSENEKILLEKDINSDLKEIYNLSVWLYDICPYVCNLNDIITMQRDQLPRRKLMNLFNLHYENKTVLQYNHPNNYIQSFRSNVDINQITVKLSYRDLVLFLKTVEYNVNLMDKDYERKMLDLTNKNRSEKNLQGGLKFSEKDMNPKESISESLNTTIQSITDQSNINSTHPLLKRKSKFSEDIMIDKGMGIMSFESSGIQIILIDDHANTYYPFLSIILQEIKVTDEHVSFTQNEISGGLLFKIVTYNYFAGIWEPFIEKSLITFGVLNERSDSTLHYRTVSVNVHQQGQQKGAMNINISDINITFLYSTLNSWMEKYFKLKSNYTEEVKKMIQMHSEKNMTITNHTVVNLTGRNLILHRANVKKQIFRSSKMNRKSQINSKDLSSNNLKNNIDYSLINSEKEISYSKLSNIEPNGSYDIEYLEDDKENFDFWSNNSRGNNNLNDISLNLVKENYVCFEFSGIDQSRISENIIKIDNEQVKTHKINYIDMIKKYKTNVDLKPMEYIVSEVKYHDLRKFVYFYSPLIMKNKLQRKVRLIFRRKDLQDLEMIIDPKKSVGVPFEYLDGSIEFKFQGIGSDTGVVYDTKTFLLQSFNKTEMKIRGYIFNLISHQSDNRKKKYITVNICPSYVIRNCLPFDIDVCLHSNTGNMNYTNQLNSGTVDSCIKIEKSERHYVESLSLTDNLLVNLKMQNFENKKYPIPLFNNKEYFDYVSIKEKNLKKSKKEEERDAGSESSLQQQLQDSYYTTSFFVYDSSNNPLKLFATLVDWMDIRTIVIYSNGVIINNTMMDLKFYYVSKNKRNLVAGQEEIRRRISNKDVSSVNSNFISQGSLGGQEKISYNSLNFSQNVLVISDEHKIAMEINHPNIREVKSEAYPINAIGITTGVECRSSDNKLKFEFLMESHLSLVAQDLEIYTNIITIHPKFVIFNNLSIPLLIASEGLSTSPEMIQPGDKKPFYFSGLGTNTPVLFRPIDNSDTQKSYQSGSKWNWSLPISLLNSGLMTVQISGINPIEKKYINMEKKILEFSTFVILSEANYYNSQFVIENYSRNVSVKIYQQGFDNSPEYANSKSKCLYAWSDYNGVKNLFLEYMVGGLYDRPVVNMSGKDYIRKFGIEEDKVLVYKNRATQLSGVINQNYFEEKVYPVCDVLKIKKSPYEGFLIKTEIFTDGMKKTIRISDFVLTNEEYEKYNLEKENYMSNTAGNTGQSGLVSKKTSSSNLLTKNTADHNSLNSQFSQSSKKLTQNNFISPSTPTFKTVTEFNIKIKKLGISLISDNRNTKTKRTAYNRFEIIYLCLNEIYFYQRIENGNDRSKTTEMQIKVSSMEIDNEYSYITQYPILLRPTAMQKDPKTGEILNKFDDKGGNSISLLPPFINFTLSSYKNDGENQHETTKVMLLNYLIQSFVFSIDSDILEAIMNFINNVTIQLKTSFTQLNPLFESYEENLKKGIIIKQEQSGVSSGSNTLISPGNVHYFLPPYYLLKPAHEALKENRGKIFIQTMETSSIEMVLSFTVQTKSRVFEKYVTSNPLFSSLLSTVSNLEKANILLNGSKMNNLYGSLFDILQLVLSQYKQNTLAQVFRIFGAIDVLGNPSNLMHNLGTGVQDFFQKPIQGIIKGPLEGVKGAIDGSMSLVKHTVDGTFNATSKITGGLSKGILYITQDEKYINELEKKKITEKPKNFVEGLGYGITSMASGLISGVSDVITKPIEGAQKESVSGFGKGVLKGIGGLFAKPISGVLELVSKTSEGIKNTISKDDIAFKPDRKPRVFYGRFKYVRKFFNNFFFHNFLFSIIKYSMLLRIFE
jgi:hypothetical protein